MRQMRKYGSNLQLICDLKLLYKKSKKDLTYKKASLYCENDLS